MSSYLKHRADLFLGVAELNRMNKFLDEDGFRTILLKNSSSFGVVKYEQDPEFKNFKVVEDVAGSGEYKITQESFAIDDTGKIIRQRSTGNNSIPNDGNWYWVKISHSYTSQEVGTVNIDSNGNVTGTNTRFTEVLRGMPSFPSKIKFIGASSNVLDYEVVEVLNDTTLLLQGTDFAPESDLKYQIVGTFTPGHVPSQPDRYPFQYDGCNISLVQETTTNQPPSKSQGQEFYIARVKNVGGTLTIHDKRVEQYRSTAEFNLSNIIKIANPLVGVEWAKFTHTSTVRDKNLLQVGFGMRTTAWTLDAPNRAITFSTGSLDAGRYKSTSQFSDGELDGWRVYFRDGSYAEIHTSEKQGTAIKCTVKEVDPVKLSTGDTLTVVPAVDQVELRAKPDEGTVINVQKQDIFEASGGFGVLELPVPENPYSYIVEYRYIKGGEASEWLQIPSDTSNGYYDESSYDEDGQIRQATNRKTYTTSSTNGFIELVRPSNAYIDFITQLITGDKFGYGEFELLNNQPDKVFTVGSEYMVQRCLGVGGGGPMTVPHRIGLSSTGASNGNSFTFIFNVGIDDSGESLTIYSGYTSVSNPGLPILQFNPEHFDYPYLEDKSVIIKCTYNGTDWVAHILEEDPSIIGDIKMTMDIDLADFPNGKATVGSKYQGWAICDGQNGTVDLGGKFPVGFDPQGSATPAVSNQYDDNYGGLGNRGGVYRVQLSAAESGLHPHSHSHSLTTASAGSHSHNKGSLRIDGNSGQHYHTIGQSTSNGYDFNTQRAGDGQRGGNSTTKTASWNGSGVSSAHTHPNSAFSGSVSQGGAHSHTIEGSISTESGSALVPHENRPPYLVVGYIQRIKQV